MLGASLLVLGGGLGWLARSREPAPTVLPPLAAAGPLPVPQGVQIVVRLDLAALRASPLGPALGGSFGGSGEIRKLCGFDPLDALEELVLSVPKGDDAGDFGIAARGGRVDAKELTQCAMKVVAQRGGAAELERVRDFEIVRDRQKGPSAGELAVRSGGPVLLGSGAHLRAMIDVASGAAPSGASEHAALEKLVQQRAIRVTFLVTDEQRKRLAEESGGEGDAPIFLALRGGAVGLDVGPFVTAHATFTCDGDAGAARIAKALKAVRDRRADSLISRALGLTPLLRKLDVEAIGKDVHAHVSLPASEVERLVAKLGGAGDRDAPGAEPERAPPVPPDLAESAPPRPSASAPASASARAPGPKKRP